MKGSRMNVEKNLSRSNICRGKCQCKMHQGFSKAHNYLLSRKTSKNFFLRFLKKEVHTKSQDQCRQIGSVVDGNATGLSI